MNSFKKYIQEIYSDDFIRNDKHSGVHIFTPRQEIIGEVQKTNILRTLKRLWLDRGKKTSADLPRGVSLVLKQKLLKIENFLSATKVLKPLIEL